MGKYTIDATALRQALTTALAFTYTGTEPLTMLKAVHIEPADDGTVEMVATDRYTLSCERLKVDGEPFALTVPYAVAKALVKMIPRPRKNSEWNGVVTFELDGSMVVARFAGDTDASMGFAPETASFPNHRSLFGSAEKAQPAPIERVMFAPKILGRVFKALADRDDMTIIDIRFQGSETTPALVTQGDTFKALVMRTPTPSA
jgi:hypothetical protein